jgi:hypothetical protein
MASPDEPVRLSAGGPGEGLQTGRVVLRIKGERLPLELTVPKRPVTVETLAADPARLQQPVLRARRRAQRGRGRTDLLPLPAAVPAAASSSALRPARRARSPAWSTTCRSRAAR